jgi:hypothetical protein
MITSKVPFDSRSFFRGSLNRTIDSTPRGCAWWCVKEGLVRPQRSAPRWPFRIILPARVLPLGTFVRSYMTVLAGWLAAVALRGSIRFSHDSFMWTEISWNLLHNSNRNCSIYRADEATTTIHRQRKGISTQLSDHWKSLLCFFVSCVLCTVWNLDPFSSNCGWFGSVTALLLCCFWPRSLVICVISIAWSRVSTCNTHDYTYREKATVIEFLCRAHSELNIRWIDLLPRKRLLKRFIYYHCIKQPQ